MPFRVLARTILQLGAELISSDGIAFYELIKNAFDAGSPRVDIDVVVRIDYPTYLSIVGDLENDRSSNGQGRSVAFTEARDRTVNSIDMQAPGAEALAEGVAAENTINGLLDILNGANYIEIRDTGEGMSLKELDEVYLTVGTRSRLKQRDSHGKGTAASESQRQKDRVVLGEKGVGRLSVMRLGRFLEVLSTKKGEARWHGLRIDWEWFSHESDSLIEAVEVEPYEGPKKNDHSTSGTTLRITGPASEWSQEKLEKIASQEFSRLTDPFTAAARYPIAIRFNGEAVAIPRFEKILFDHSHAVVEANYRIDPEKGPLLVGKIDYRLHRREKIFEAREVDLHSITKASRSTLQSLGPFGVKFYWYNRPLLKEIEGIGDLKRVRELQARWAGGLMLFRDGFRVNPYGDPDDDWLDIDRKALASPGYKVNRRQIIGKVDISSRLNPHFIDQTNREGLRDCPEKAALISILQHIVASEFRTFLNKVDQEKRAREPVTFDDLEVRVQDEERQIRQSLRTLVRKFPQIKDEPSLIGSINRSIKTIRGLLKEAQELADSYQQGRTEIIHLAGLGLMVEIIAHELNRATHNTLVTLSSRISKVPSDTDATFGTLEAQLKTLQKRLRVLDPLSTAGRQVKEKFDLVPWIKDILQSHEGQFKRHSIHLEVRVEPKTAKASMRVEAVKGMYVQVLENLISNSVYWLKQQKRLDPTFRPIISVVFDTVRLELRFTDNGPGIPPPRREEVFEPFVTTKPPGEGRGLGLYIAREIAHYHGANLYLSDECTVHKDMLNTFVFDLQGKRTDGSRTS